jgi:TP901 family phage tail tape measure protein
VNSMLGSTAELAVLIKLKDEITGPLNKIDHSLSGLNTRAATVGGGMSKIGSGLALGAERVAVGLIAVGGAVAAVAVKSTEAAATYQSAMELIHTQAGATQAEVDYMGQALLKLAPQVGTSATELAAGLYHIESAGLRSTKALETLRVAAEGAKVGQADLQDVTNALVGAENTGIAGTQNLSLAMGTLNGIVGAGNMRMADLTGAIATGILPTAKSMGLTLTDVGAALADMTDQGVPAVDAATRLRMTFSLMAAPTSKAATELKSIGMTSTSMANDMRQPNGLLVALTDLKTHLDNSGKSAVEQTQIISGAFGGGRTSSTILTLLGSLDRLDTKYQSITSSTNNFGDAWNSTASTIDEKKANVAASLDALKIQLGEQLLPVEGKVLDAATKLFSSPAVAKGIADFGTALASMFTDSNMAGAEKFVSDVIPGLESFATNVLPPLEAGLKITGAAAKTAFDMFMSLPQPVQAAVIAALAANKLTGGLVASGIGDLARVGLGAATGKGGGGGALGGILGAQHVWVDNMGAGGMGGAGAGVGTAAGGASMMSVAVRSIIPIAIAAGSIYELAQVYGDFQKGNAAAQTATNGQIADWKATPTTTNESTAALAAEVKTYRDNTGDLLHSFLLNNAANTQMGDALTAAADKLAAGTTITPEGIQALKDAVATGKDMLGNSTNDTRGYDTTLLAQLEADLKVALTKQQVTPVVQAANDQAATAAREMAAAVRAWPSASQHALDAIVQAQRTQPLDVNVNVNVSSRDIQVVQVQRANYRTAVAQ